MHISDTHERDDHEVKKKQLKKHRGGSEKLKGREVGREREAWCGEYKLSPSPFPSSLPPFTPLPFISELSLPFFLPQRTYVLLFYSFSPFNPLFHSSFFSLFHFYHEFCYVISSFPSYLLYITFLSFFVYSDFFPIHSYFFVTCIIRFCLFLPTSTYYTYFLHFPSFFLFYLSSIFLPSCLSAYLYSVSPSPSPIIYLTSPPSVSFDSIFISRTTSIHLR